MTKLKTYFTNFCKKLIPYTNQISSFNYIEYWENRYRMDGNSGSGSCGVLAEFKARTVNDFINNNIVNTVVEFGCGDGRQIELSNYPNYLGLDIAKSAIGLCQKKFSRDFQKSFMLYHPRYFSNNCFISADLVLCLDVLYHIIDERDYLKTLQDIFSTSKKFVMLYTNLESNPSNVPHIIYRDTLKYLKRFHNFQILKFIEQLYPDLSSAKFIILHKII